MHAAALPLPPATWDALPAAARGLILALQAQVVALRTEVAALQTQRRELEARLGQDSSNSPHPPRPFPSTGARRHGRPSRHQVVELLPLAMRLTAYQLEVRRCAHCGKRTRAALPHGVPRRPFGPRLVAVLALLTGRYRSSRREVRQVLQDLWGVRLSRGAVVRQERARSAALAPVIAAVRAAVQHANVVNMDETGWRQEQQRAWLWTAVTAELTLFLIDRHRSGAVVGAPPGSEFRGTVGSDRWSAYRRFPAERRARCWAHLKRDFQALVDRGGAAAPMGRWGLAEIARLSALWHRSRHGECSWWPEHDTRTAPRRCAVARWWSATASSDKRRLLRSSSATVAHRGAAAIASMVAGRSNTVPGDTMSVVSERWRR